MSSHQEALLDLIAAEALIEREKLSLDAPLDSLGIDSVDFVTSLSSCRHWSSSGGKSGMTFYKTQDDRLENISKSGTRSEP